MSAKRVAGSPRKSDTQDRQATEADLFVDAAQHPHLPVASASRLLVNDQKGLNAPKSRNRRELNKAIKAEVLNKISNIVLVSPLTQHNSSVKKGTAVPASGGGSPELRQSPPLLQDSDEVASPAKVHHPLPQLPKGLSWPQNDYDKSPEFNKWGGLERYLRSEWAQLVPHIDMPTMREHWPEAAQAIDRQRTKLPEELLPLRDKELTDRMATEIPNRGDRPWRLEKALQMRAYRARKKLKKLSM